MKIVIAVLTVLFIIITGCERSETVKDNFSYGDIKSIGKTQWEALSKKRIFFGHQSVGENIIDGMKDVMKENPEIRLAIVESDNPEELKEGVFEHFKIGINMQPLTKIDAFSNLIRSGIGNSAEIAFFKFCYVDINKSADVDALFKNYQQEMAGLKKTYPNVTFIHVTAPLLENPEQNIKYWIKYCIKKIIGRNTGNEGNIARNMYNQLLKDAYEDREPVFDLARLESISPDGSVSCFTQGQKRFISLCPAYTYDGGHLNETGRKFIAGQLLVFLAGLN